MLNYECQALMNKPQPSLTSRLLWFAGLWLAGVLTVSAVAYAIRAAIL